MQEPRTTRHADLLPMPTFDLGQHVSIRRGIHRGASGRIITCEFDGSSHAWVYRVKNAQEELGPFEASDLR